MKALDMTKGSAAKTLLLFAIPMILGNLFQQLYNIVDTLVVGNFVGSQAVAAIGSATPVVFVMIAVAMGLTTGCSILVSQYFGAQDHGNMRKAAYTSLVFITLCAVAITIVFLFVSEPLLRLMGTPEDIMADSLAYLEIFNFGLVFLFFYNAMASIMRALGDSKTPLYFLVFTTVLNIILDLVLVLNAGMGVAGVAWGTFVSQAASAGLIFLYFLKKFPMLKFRKEDRVIKALMLKNLLRYGVPSTVQQFIISFSFMAMQGLVNSFGVNVIAGYTAATKIDNIAIMPVMNLMMALSTFVAQNIGAGKLERVKEGFKTTLLVSVGISVAIAVVVLLFGDTFINAFVGAEHNAEVLATGVNYIHIVSIFYFLFSIMFSAGSVLRGAGDVLPFMIASIVNLGARIVAAYCLAPILGAAAIQWSMPVGWAVGAIFNCIRYKSGKWKTKAVVAM